MSTVETATESIEVIDPKYQSFGEFIKDVILAGRDSDEGAERRLQQRGHKVEGGMDVERRAAAGASEAVMADGGFLLQPDWANTILQRAYQESAVLRRCNTWTVQKNAIKIPAIDETSRTDGNRFGGARGYWMNEADTLTGSKPRIRNMELYPKKLGVLCYETSELMDDLGALQQYVITILGKEVAFKVTDAIILGDGAGKPQGIMNSPALISIARSSGNVIAATDVLGMLKRFWVGSRTDKNGYTIDGNLADGPKPAWFCHSDTVDQLAQCVIAVGGGGSLAFLLNPETMNMMSFPVIPIEQCLSLGTKGDLILADLNEYQLAWRNPGQLDVSMHVKFTNDEQALRLIVRVDGQGGWSTPVTPMNGTNTQSPFVSLNA